MSASNNGDDIGIDDATDAAKDAANIAETGAIVLVVGLVLGTVLEVLKFVGAIDNNPLKPLLDGLADTLTGDGVF